MINLYSKERAEQLEQEIQDNLIKIDNESRYDNILKQKDQLELLQLEQQKLKEKIQQQKTIIQVNKVKEIDQRRNQLIDRLNFLNSRQPEEIQDEKFKIISLRKQIEDINKKEANIYEKQINIQKEEQIVNKVRKKMVLEQILKQKNDLYQQFQQKKLESEVIQEQIKQRNFQNKDILDRALIKCGGTGLPIQENSMYEQNVNYFASQLIDNLDKDKKNKSFDVKGLLTDINAQQQVALQSLKSDNEEKVKQLNQRRYEIHEQQEQLLQVKAKLNDKSTDQYRKQVDMKSTLDKANLIIQNGPQRLKNLIPTTVQNQTYRQELQPIIKNMNPEHVLIARSIINYILEMSFREIQFKEFEVQKIQLMKTELEQKEAQIDKVQSKNIIQNQIKTSQQNIQNKIITEMVNDVAKSMHKLHDFIQGISNDILLNGLCNKNKQINKEKLKKQIMADHQESNNFSKFTNTQQKSNKSIIKKEESIIKVPNIEAKAMYDWQECVENIGSESLLSFEVNFFSNILFQEQVQAKYEKFGKITAMQMNQNNELLAVGYDKGQVRVYKNNEIIIQSQCISSQIIKIL